MPCCGRALSSLMVGRNPASVLPAPVGAISIAEAPASVTRRTSSWCRRGSQPRCANQAVIAGWRGMRRSGIEATMAETQQQTLRLTPADALAFLSERASDLVRAHAGRVAL